MALTSAKPDPARRPRKRSENVKHLTDDDLREVIDDISQRMKYPMPYIERLAMHEDRKEFRRELERREKEKPCK